MDTLHHSNYLYFQSKHNVNLQSVPTNNISICGFKLRLHKSKEQHHLLKVAISWTTLLKIFPSYEIEDLNLGIRLVTYLISQLLCEFIFLQVQFYCKTKVKYANTT